MQQPHIPIWVGGKTKPAVRRVARYGTGYHTVASSPSEVRDEVAAVAEEMERAGRDPAEIVVSMLAAFVVTSGRDHLVDLIGEYRDAGLHHLVGIPALQSRGPRAPHERLADAVEDLEQFAVDVLPAVR